MLRFPNPGSTTGNFVAVYVAAFEQYRGQFPNAELIGYDNGYFAHCLTNASYFPECRINKQIFGDLREFPFETLDNVDVIIHLAAISNDPMGNSYENVTVAINDMASKTIAIEAKKRGVNKFIFASSCSMYG